MRKGTCKHFNGVQNNVCIKGVRYDDIRKEDHSIACIQKFHTRQNGLESIHKHHPPSCCWAFEESTDEEIKAYEEEIDQLVKRTTIARKAIMEHHEKTGGWSGSLECPICKGFLGYTIAECNGHVHAACNTKDCVRWME